MKNLALFATILFSLLITASCKQEKLRKLQAEADSIAVKYVPDSRIGLCNIRVVLHKGSIILKGETTGKGAINDIIKTLGKHNIDLIDSVIILPDTSVYKKYKALACLSVINLRKEPDFASELVSQSLMGAPLTILREDDSWYLVQTPDGYIAWTESSSLVPLTVEEMNKWKRADRIIFMNNTGWIYAGSSENTGVVSDIVAGNILEKTGLAGDYTKVRLPDGREGYVRTNDIMDFSTFCNRPPANADAIVSRAESLLGIPYLWGGTSVKAADCSGFVQTVYFMNGIILMRDASLQALHGAPVDISNGFGNLESGDLLFFGYMKNNKQHVIHAAIYIGDEDYINSAGRVRINSLDSTKSNFSSYRLNSLLQARRIIGITNDRGISPVGQSSLYR